jgi:hypothetical protein
VIRRIVQGAEAQVEALLQTTQGVGVITTAYIERLNATFRSRIATLVRRGRALARQRPTLHDGMYLVGTVYNFCRFIRAYVFHFTCLTIGAAGCAEHPLLQLGSQTTDGLSRNYYRFVCLHRFGSRRSGVGGYQRL